MVVHTVECLRRLDHGRTALRRLPPLNPMPHNQTNVSWTRSLQRHTHTPYWTEKLSKLNAL